MKFAHNIFLGIAVLSIAAGFLLVNNSFTTNSNIARASVISFNLKPLYDLNDGNNIDSYSVKEDVRTGNLIYETYGTYSYPSSVIPYSQLSAKEIAMLHRLYGYVIPNYNK